MFGLHGPEVIQLVLIPGLIAKMFSSRVGQVVDSHLPHWGFTAEEVFSFTVGSPLQRSLPSAFCMV